MSHFSPFIIHKSSSSHIYIVCIDFIQSLWAPSWLISISNGESSPSSAFNQPIALNTSSQIGPTLCPSDAKLSQYYYMAMRSLSHNGHIKLNYWYMSVRWYIFDEVVRRWTRNLGHFIHLIVGWEMKSMSMVVIGKSNILNKMLYELTKWIQKYVKIKDLLSMFVLAKITIVNSKSHDIDKHKT